MGNGKNLKASLNERSEMQKHVLHDLNYMPCPEKANLLKLGESPGQLMATGGLLNVMQGF